MKFDTGRALKFGTGWALKFGTGGELKVLTGGALKFGTFQLLLKADKSQQNYKTSQRVPALNE
jgi:hypothetical protein